MSLFCCNAMNIGIGIGLPNGGGGQAAGPDPVPDFLFKYNLDGFDSALTRFGTNNFRRGIACEDNAQGVSSQFDGSTQYYTSSDLSKTAIGTSDFTISGWVKTTLTIDQTIISTGAGGTNEFRVRATGGGNIQLRVGGNTKVSNTSINDGKWHRFDLVGSSASATTLFYIDGVQDADRVLSPYDFNGVGSLEVGSISGGTLFNGGIDDIRFYDRALTPTEITTLYNYQCGFDPSQIPTNAWYDASDVSATNIIQSAGAVSQWSDKSGNNRDQIQSTALQQPSTETNTINGLNTLYGDGVDDKTSGLLSLPTSGDFMFFSVCQPVAVDNSADGIYGTTDGSSDTELRSNSLSQFDGRVITTLNGSVDYASGPFSTPNIFSVRYDFTNSEIKGFLNSELDTGIALYTTKVDSTTLRLFRGRFSEELEAAIGEFIILDNPTTENIEKVHGYLAWKWFPTTDRAVGNPALPVGHPYKLTPPEEV